MPTKMISFRIPNDLYEYFLKKSEEENRSLSNIILNSLTDIKSKEPCKISFKNFAPTCEKCNAPIAPEEANYCYKCGRKFVGCIK